MRGSMRPVPTASRQPAPRFAQGRQRSMYCSPPSSRRRLNGYPLSWRGLDRVRFVRVLKWMVEDTEIEGVPVLPMPYVDLGSSPYEFRIRDGVHRFYASVAMGFSHLAVDRTL